MKVWIAVAQRVTLIIRVFIRNAPSPNFPAKERKRAMRQWDAEAGKLVATPQRALYHGGYGLQIGGAPVRLQYGV